MVPPASTRTFAALAVALCGTCTGAYADTLPNSDLQPSVWLDASTLSLVLTDGASVDLWADMSGNARSAIQGNAARQPVFHTEGAGGFPVVRFNLELQPGGTANQFLAFPGAIGNETEDVMSVYMVAFDSGTRSTATSRATAINTRTNGGSVNGFLFGYSTEGTLLADYAHVGHRDLAQGPSATLQFTSFGEADMNLLTLNREGLTSIVSTFTDIDATSTTGTWNGFTPSTLSTTQIGTEGGSHYFFGDIAEIIVFEGVSLTNAEHEEVVKYLGDKYDIAFAAAIPEPSSLLLGAVAGAGLLMRRRRR